MYLQRFHPSSFINHSSPTLSLPAVAQTTRLHPFAFRCISISPSSRAAPSYISFSHLHASRATTRPGHQYFAGFPSASTIPQYSSGPPPAQCKALIFAPPTEPASLKARSSSLVQRQLLYYSPLRLNADDAPHLSQDCRLARPLRFLFCTSRACALCCHTTRLSA